MIELILKFLKNAALFLGSFYIFALTALYFFQDSLLFPAPQVPDKELSSGAEFLGMKTSDGTVLRHVRLRNIDDSPKIIFFHGNGSLALHELQRGYELQRAGFDVLLAEYRGYGGSGGRPTGKLLLSDGLETYDHFIGNNDARVFLYAHSLGTGVATHIASKRNVNGIVLESPYASLAEVAAGRYPVFPVQLLFRHEINSLAAMQNVAAPVLMVHGKRDSVI
ncbi:MAG: alpha/beta fold hydrolase, partial [Pseudomonadota bacterium]